MGLTIADTYYLKAKAAMGGFCSDWGEVTENLNYALSYDEDHCAALCLLGKVYAGHLASFTEAYECFDKVIATNPNYIGVYGPYIKYLIWNEEQERAEKLIAFALTIKGIGKGEINWLNAYLLETKYDYKSALKRLKTAKKEVYNDGYLYFIEEEEKRIKKKVKLVKKGGKSKKDKKKKAKKGKKGKDKSKKKGRK